MMDFSAEEVIGAGLVATKAMTAVLYIGISMMPKQMTMNLLYMLDTMVTQIKTAAYLISGVMHAIMGIVFGLIHACIYTSLDVDSGCRRIRSSTCIHSLDHGWRRDGWDNASVDEKRRDDSSGALCEKPSNTDGNGVLHASPALRSGFGLGRGFRQCEAMHL